MSNAIKASVFDIEISKNDLWLSTYTLEDLLKELSEKLDDEDSENTRILDVNSNDKETSIWFDSFDDTSNFSKESIFNDTVCFLLAKDMNYQLVEDKETRQIKSSSSNKKLKPKIPSHCVLIKSQNILLMEEATNTPTALTLKRGIIDNLRLKQNDLIFKARYRENIVERLSEFVNSIESIEMIDLNIENYLKDEVDSDGYLQNFLYNPDTKITAKLQIETNDWKTKVVNFFVDTFNNRLTKEVKNIKVSYKDDKQNKDIISLYENLVYLKIEKDLYFDDISNLIGTNRLEYSKEIYRTIIKAYNETME